MANKQDVSNAAYKLGRLVNGGVIGYYAGGKTSQVMSKTLPQDIIAVVEKHKKIQLGSSLAQSFIPGAGVAAMAVAVASIWKMYYDINKVLGITISENAGKSLTSAILTNLASFTAKGVSTVVSEGAKFIPIVGWIASAAISTVTTTAIVYGSAYLYLNALTKMYEAEGKFDLEYLKSVVENTTDDDDDDEIDSDYDDSDEDVEDEYDEVAVINQSVCINCGACAAECDEYAIDEDDESYTIDPDLCTRCGACISECPVNAISFVNKA